jgi:hypothetical protein
MKKLIVAALAIGLIVAVVKKKASGRAEWHGMSEAQVRDRLGERFPAKMPDDAKAAVTNKIVDKMRQKGAIIDLTDDDDAAADEADEADVTDSAIQEDAPTT